VAKLRLSHEQTLSMSKFELENVLDEAALAYFAYLFAHFHLRQQAQINRIRMRFFQFQNFKLNSDFSKIIANLDRAVIFVYSTVVRHELIDNSTGGNRARSIFCEMLVSRNGRESAYAI
jgi:hypothetical protein